MPTLISSTALLVPLDAAISAYDTNLAMEVQNSLFYLIIPSSYMDN